MGRYGGGDYGRGFGARMPREWNGPRGFGPPRGPDYNRAYDRGWYGVGGPQRGYGTDYSAQRRFSRPAYESDVDRIRIADIMTHNPVAMNPDTPLVEIALQMRDLNVGAIPIVDNDESMRLQGIVTDRDIAIRAAAEAKGMKKTLAREIMTSEVETVGENDHIRQVFEVMKRARVRRVPVVDASGRLVGIVAQADLVVNYAGLDLQRETEVEEVIERISEPARPRWGREDAHESRLPRVSRTPRSDAEADFPDRLRRGWRTLRREARQMIGRGYDRGWR